MIFYIFKDYPLNCEIEFEKEINHRVLCSLIKSLYLKKRYWRFLFNVLKEILVVKLQMQSIINNNHIK